MQSELVNPEAVATLGKNDMDDDKQTQKYNKKLTIVVL
jgi:hypothetical protein